MSDSHTVERYVWHRLNNQNYAEWVLRMEAVLIKQGLWDNIIEILVSDTLPDGSSRPQVDIITEFNSKLTSRDPTTTTMVFEGHCGLFRELSIQHSENRFLALAVGMAAGTLLALCWHSAGTRSILGPRSITAINALTLPSTSSCRQHRHQLSVAVVDNVDEIKPRNDEKIMWAPACIPSQHVRVLTPMCGSVHASLLGVAVLLYPGGDISVLAVLGQYPKLGMAVLFLHNRWFRVELPASSYVAFHIVASWNQASRIPTIYMFGLTDLWLKATQFIMVYYFCVPLRLDPALLPFLLGDVIRPHRSVRPRRARRGAGQRHADVDATKGGVHACDRGECKPRVLLRVRGSAFACRRWPYVEAPAFSCMPAYTSSAVAGGIPGMGDAELRRGCGRWP
ncbi:hypothetical protein GGX14DRAFT_397908 [Mycena pura]|uniref:DUF4219 domain-containing protein n=1 Tax=Mycena pura TaxID=153505 RepID=A0AAD6YA43_9AGAR|nr:hypothetical protein GGX14DRAFT_397908 [Mycena pura]